MMTTKRIRLVAGVLIAIALSAPATQAQGSNLIFNHLRGALHISQGVPCGGVVEATTSIAEGIMHVSPSTVRADGIGSDKVFDLTRLDMFLTPFSAQAECRGLRANVEFRQIGVRLASNVTFTGQNLGDGRYRFVIPREQFLILESVTTNLPVPQPMTEYKRPSEDVSGEIDLRRGTAALHVALSTRLRVRFGCMDNGRRCVIDEIVEGRQTADITGGIQLPGTDTDGGVPDTMAPTLSCTPIAQPRRHQVTSADDSGGRPTLKLGTFLLENGEVIQIEETGQPGVRLLGTVGNDGIRHFQVGKGQGLVTATDESGNIARAACGVQANRLIGQ